MTQDSMLGPLLFFINGIVSIIRLFADDIVLLKILIMLQLLSTAILIRFQIGHVDFNPSKSKGFLISRTPVVTPPPPFTLHAQCLSITCL